MQNNNRVCLISYIHSLLMIREVSAMLRVKGAMLFELSGKDEIVCYAQLKDYFEQMYFAN